MHLLNIFFHKKGQDLRRNVKYYFLMSTFLYQVYLESGKKYYFEILWKQAIGRSHVRLVWKKPNQDSFEDVDPDGLSSYYNDELLQDGIVFADHFKSDIEMSDLPCHITQKHKDDKSQRRDTPYQRDSVEFLLLPTIKFASIQGVLPLCEYKPSYLLLTDSDKSKLVEGQYNGVHLPHYYNISTRVHPADGTWGMSRDCIGSDSLKPIHCEGNKILAERIAKSVTNLFMNALEAQFGR